MNKPIMATTTDDRATDLDPVAVALAQIEDRIGRRIGFAAAVEVAAVKEGDFFGYRAIVRAGTALYTGAYDTAAEMIDDAARRWEEYQRDRKDAELLAAKRLLESNGWGVQAPTPDPDLIPMV